jgi:sulfopyruvate decarboxylase subunit alpha
MSVDLKLYEEMKRSNISLILSLPCIMLKDLLYIIEEKKEIQHIGVTREEEGVGIAAGAYLGGKVPAILMQNSGLGNSGG